MKPPDCFLKQLHQFTLPHPHWHAQPLRWVGVGISLRLNLHLSPWQLKALSIFSCISCASPMKCLFKSSAHFFIRLFVFFLLLPITLRWLPWTPGQNPGVAQLRGFMTWPSPACLQTPSNSHFSIHWVPNHSTPPSPWICAPCCRECPALLPYPSSQPAHGPLITRLPGQVRPLFCLLPSHLRDLTDSDSPLGHHHLTHDRHRLPPRR